MIEIGAGGGSIARINALGIVQVGPDSAGADPGPVCYGLGGTEPTVSDADLALGYLDPELLRRRHHAARPRRRRAAIATAIADAARPRAPWSRPGPSMTSSTRPWPPPCACTSASAAATRRDRCSRLRRRRSGPCYNLAAKLGMPAHPGAAQGRVLSALGLVMAPAAFDIARTRKVPLQALNFAKLAAEVADLRGEIAAKLREVDDAAAPRFEVALGLGYVAATPCR